ncbi:hypothetical protein [Campylobacter ureolyticus]|uniref:hypothetical protein n=1 Tax=Campylobacter ureolyticus TaxID=827 RepID=UPI0026EF6657|nr:hypothetical protein [Campylobacter ureolyticus]
MRYFFFSLIFNLIVLFLPFVSFKTYAQAEVKSVNISVNEVFKSVEALETSDEVMVNNAVEALEQDEVVEVIKEKKEITPAKKEKKKIDKKPSKNLNKKTLNNSSKNKTLSKNSVLRANNKPKNNDFCKENVGFIVINPKNLYDFPKKAKLLRLKGEFKAEVSFKVQNGGIKILNVKGSNKIFENEAIRLTKELKFKILDERVFSCVITKPFVFISK